MICIFCSLFLDIVFDLYFIVDEWVVEDYIGNIIFDYRDIEIKFYEVFLKWDFC